MGFRYGEFVLVICPSGVRRLLRLHNGGVYRWPRMTRPPLTHKDLVERESSYIIINKDIFRRPTLEEYVVLMDRVPAPTYPKDAQTMMAMLDIAGGDVVMEAGAGSGGLALHLSRSVGIAGQVYSFESIPRHMQSAVTNYNQWRSHWALSHDTPWPDNVKFIPAHAEAASEHVTSVDAIALDLSEPGPLLTQLLPILKPCGLVSVYLPNITQYVTLLDHIKAQGLPLQLEKVVEVLHREWHVQPVADKNSRLAYLAQEEGQQRYACRPSYRQNPHTAFLGLLRSLPART